MWLRSPASAGVRSGRAQCLSDSVPLLVIVRVKVRNPPALGVDGPRPLV